MKFLVLSLALLTVGLRQTFAQEKLKEGKITFEISYPDAEDMSDQQLAMMPKETVVYFKGDKSRGETKMSYGTVTYFTDAKTKESIVCMDMMNRKTAIKSTAADEEKQKADMGDYDVKLTDQTKTIAGYKCKKAVVTFKEKGNSMDVWYTNDLGATNSASNMYKGIDGYLMEFIMERPGYGGGTIKMKMTATKVEKIPISDDMFKIPDGYTVMTKDEMMQEMKERKVASPKKDAEKKEEQK